MTMNFQDALVLARPEIFLAGATLVLLVYGAFRGEKGMSEVSIGASLALFAAAALAAVGPDGAAFSGGFVANSASRFAKVAVYLICPVAILLGDRWLGRVDNKRFEFPILILLAAIGMGMMVSAGDLISLYIGIELQSLALYVLAAFRRDDAKASEAGLKYFVLGALSSGLLLYGASLIYGFAGSTHFDVIAQSIQNGTTGTGVLFGLVFLMCGLAFKVSAAPFHMWTPDVYEGAPTPIVAFFAAAPKLAAMVLFARVLSEAFGSAIDQWRQIIVITAFLSVAIGAFGGLAQSNIKRLLGYSSIANIGYALIGLSAGTAEGMQAILVFMVLYMIDVTGFFACLGALSRDGKPMETLNDFAGLARVRPGLALALTALSFSVMGLPPFSGFWAKLFVFKAAIASGQWILAAVLLLGSVVAAFYYLRLIKTMWFDPAPGQTDNPPLEAKGVAFAAALFCFPLVLPAMAWLEPLARTAAVSFGLK